MINPARHFIISFLLFSKLLPQHSTLNDSVNWVQKQLDSTQIRLQNIEQMLNEIVMREHQTLQRLELLKEKISLTENYLRQIDYRIAHYNREISSLNTELAHLIDRQKELEERLKRRLVGIYKYSKFYRLQALLTSRNLPEYYRRIINLRLISRIDQKLIAETKQLNLEIKTKQTAIQSALVAQQRLKHEAETRKQQLLKDREQEQLILLQIRREKSAKAAIKAELESAAQKLNSMLGEMKTRIATSSGEVFETKRGKLPWPVSGNVIVNFGPQIHPRYRTRINSSGIDIKVNQPSGVRVIAPGKVAYADRFIGYGNLVIVDHGNGYFSLYGNLASINTAIDAVVSNGTIIGTVTDYLHFEIRKDGQPLDPKEWLE